MSRVWGVKGQLWLGVSNKVKHIQSGAEDYRRRVNIDSVIP